MASTTARALYRHDDLRRLIDPRVVAIVGASETRGSFGERTLSNLSAFTGKVYAINPKYQNLLGRPCVPALSEMPESPDCVVLCVARPMVEDMIKSAAAVKAGGVIVYASGFAETSKPDRIEAQQRLLQLSRNSGVRVVGPNCVGLANTRSGAGLNFMPDYAGMGHRRGPIGIVSQSGALGYTVLQGMQRGIGFSHYLAAGNSCDVDVCDFISYLAEDEDTKSIICLLEGVKDGARFLAAAGKARGAGKALIVYKTGNSETSSKAAMSHTGTMVGSVVAYQTAIRDAGAIAVDNLEAVLETASFFAKTKAPTKGRGVGILSTSGGAAVICADKAEAHDIPLPTLEAKTARALHEVVPDFGSVANPSDLTAEVLKTSETFGFCLDAFTNDSGFSALVMPMIFAHASSSGARVPAIVEAAARTDRPLAVVWMNEWYQGPGSELLDADPKVCMFRSADRCFATLRAWLDWHEGRG
ncbi:MAG TPA: CoA-binding protein, partial [Bradyrhizobium sp.]|nr:CoA-binding protein [Bradyrhizobium sp.]